MLLDGVEQRADVVERVGQAQVHRGVAGEHPRRPRLRLHGRAVGQLHHPHRKIPPQRIVFLALHRRCIDRRAHEEFDVALHELIDVAAGALDGVEAVFVQDLGNVLASCGAAFGGACARRK